MGRRRINRIKGDLERSGMQSIWNSFAIEQMLLRFDVLERVFRCVVVCKCGRYFAIREWGRSSEVRSVFRDYREGRRSASAKEKFKLI